jgi:hypothetical protein
MRFIKLINAKMGTERVDSINTALVTVINREADTLFVYLVDHDKAVRIADPLDIISIRLATGIDI